MGEIPSIGASRLSLSPSVWNRMIPLIAAASIHLCTNQLATQLAAGGFHGKRLQYAWAIVQRESHGHAKEISATHDYGLFQINRAAYHKESWWQPKALLTPKYNIHVAFTYLTQGGHTFWQWGVTGNGKRHAGYTNASEYAKFRMNLSRFPAMCKAI